MPKATDITGTFRVPQESWGSFWNFMLSCPGADITPNTRASSSPATAPAKRANGKAKDGTSGRCIVLNALSETTSLPTKTLNQMMIGAGKAPGTLGGLVFTMQKDKQLKKVKGGYAITAAGRSYLKSHCEL